MDSQLKNIDKTYKRRGASSILKDHQEVNNLSPRQERKKKKRSILKLFIAGIILTLVGSVIVFIWSFYSATSSTFQFDFWQTPIKQEEGRINFLLLGNAGGNHAGATLTDSIIVASYDLKTKKTLLVSIPRDLWLENIKLKINAAYEAGTWDKNGGDGLKFAKEKIGTVVGLPIHYGIRIDFNGFAKAVDLIEGIDVDIPRTFDDYQYPIEGKENDWCGFKEKEIVLTEDIIKALGLQVASNSATPSASTANFVQVGEKRKVLFDSHDNIALTGPSFTCRYEHISFKKGMMHMDGKTALKFVRSRMGTNGEGSDFARSRRQQLVLQSFREKALSLQTLSNPQKIMGLLNTFGKSIETDIPGERIPEFYNFVKNADSFDSVVLGDLGNGNSVFVTPPAALYGGAWVLIPPQNDFTLVKNLIKNKLEEQATSSARQAKLLDNYIK